MNMKDTFIKHKGKLYPLWSCKVYADCIRHITFDEYDEIEETVMFNGEWEYIEQERVIDSMTMIERLAQDKIDESFKSTQARLRKERFEQEYPNWRDFPDNTIRHKYYEDNPI